jgi:pimeloyl-ACP methyl ester carboxylesterase
MRRFDIRIGGVLPELPGAEQAVTLVVPGAPAAQAAPAAADAAGVVLCAYPGGGYARGYYDVEWQGGRAYSEAQYHAQRGWVVACIDHLGVGDSSPVDASVRLRDLARADAAVATKIAAGLRDGSLVDGLGPLAVDTVIGVGQSMGGHLVTVAQADHRPFDRVAVLGSSAIHTVLPAASTFRRTCHWDDVDPEIVDADQDGFPVRATMPHWASATAPPDAVTLLEPEVQAEEAAAIDVPVFVGCGERDVVPDPWLEPSAYRSSRDISLLVVERMAHMHNFAGTRARLWDALHAWGA